MDTDRKDPHLPYGQTIIYERVTLADSTRFLLTCNEARALIRDSLAHRATLCDADGEEGLMPDHTSCRGMQRGEPQQSDC